MSNQVYTMMFTRIGMTAEHRSVTSILQRWADNHDTKLKADLLGLIHQRREFDLLFTAVLDALKRSSAADQNKRYVTSTSVLDMLQDDFFATLSPLSAYEMAKQLGELLRATIAELNESAFASAAALTYRLLCAVPLLSANRLREWVHTCLIDVFAKLNDWDISEADNQVTGELFGGGAALLVISVYTTLTVELHYGVAEAAEQWVVWRRLTGCPTADRVSSIINTGTLLLGAAAGDKKRTAKGARRLARSDDGAALFTSVPKHLRHLVYGDVSFNFILWNLPALAAAVPAIDDLRGVVDRLVAYSAAASHLPAFLATFERATNLRYSLRGAALQALLVGNLRTTDNIRFRNDTANYDCVLAGEEPSANGSQTPAVNGNGIIINGIKPSKKRKHAEEPIDIEEDANDSTSADTQQQQQFELFDGKVLLLRRLAERRYELTLRDSVNAPSFTAARKQLKSLKRACIKAFQLFMSVRQPSGKAAKISHSAAGDAATDHRRGEALAALLKLSTAIRACRLPYNVIASVLHPVNSYQLAEMSSALFDESLAALVRENASEVLYVLEHLARVCGTNLRLIPLDDSRLVDLLLADSSDSKEGQRTAALSFAATFLAKNRAELNNVLAAPIISLCLAFCRPVANLLGRQSTSISADGDESTYPDVEEEDDGSWKEKAVPRDALAERVQAFALAELAFLTTAVGKFTSVTAAQSGLVMSLLADFFHLLHIYRENHWHDEEEKLQRKLAVLCGEIKREPKGFHKAIPFAMSSWLAVERRSTLSQPMYVLLSACDNFDLALMSANLRQREKHKFAAIQKQFYRLNKIIG